MCPRSWLLVVTVASVACGGSEKDRDDEVPVDGWTPMVQQLNALEGVSATELGQYSDGSIVYDLRVTQPVDHALPDGATFEQRAILRYNGRPAGPTVMLTDGYAIQYFDDDSGYVYFTEPTVMLNANQLEVEHRYFGASVPEPVDWSKLDIAQAAADHHTMRERLAPIFTGTWVATGGSKSGMAALYYRFFHPDDVSATVAYVAPLMTGRNDDRFATGLTTVGDSACRDSLAAFQRAALDDEPRSGAVTTSRRDAMVDRYRDIFGATSVSLICDDAAYELAVGMAPFTFWQYSDPALCAAVPNAETPD
ncbi:MAG TPA: S28 family serine protease, partial [Myxococcota bacterium]|nr:S28 family serine protease [Myxococcota bacterium]